MKPPKTSGDPKPPATQSKRKRAPQKRAIDTRAAIIRAAIKEFSDFGFTGATTRKIAAEAGVLNSLLHYHFPEKERLWEVCADALYANFGAELRRIRVRKPLGEEQLRAVFELYLRTFLENPAMARFGHLEADSDVERKNYLHQVHLTELHEWLTESAQVAQSRGTFPPGDAALIIAFVLGGIVNIGARKLDMEYILQRRLDSQTTEAFSQLVETLIFRANAAKPRS